MSENTTRAGTAGPKKRNPDGYRMNVYFKADIWERLSKHVKQRKRDVAPEISYSGEIHRALERYLPAVK